MKKKELMEFLKELDDEQEIVITALNAPPWITQFSMSVKRDDDEQE